MLELTALAHSLRRPLLSLPCSMGWRRHYIPSLPESTVLEGCLFYAPTGALPLSAFRRITRDLQVEVEN